MERAQQVHGVPARRRAARRRHLLRAPHAARRHSRTSRDTQVIVYTPWEGRSPDSGRGPDHLSRSSPSSSRRRRCAWCAATASSAIPLSMSSSRTARTSTGRARACSNTCRASAGNCRPASRPRSAPTPPAWAGASNTPSWTGAARTTSPTCARFQDWHLRYWLQSVEGVAEVATFGGFEKQYQVELDPNHLLAYNVPLDRIVGAIRSANNDVGGRELERYGTTYLVRGHGYIKSLDDLRLVVVGADASGTPVLLKDVAQQHRARPGDAPRRGRLQRRGRNRRRHRRGALRPERAAGHRPPEAEARRGEAVAAARRRDRHHLRPLRPDPPQHRTRSRARSSRRASSSRSS